MFSRRRFIRTVILGSAGSFCPIAQPVHASFNSNQNLARYRTEQLSEDFSVCHQVRSGRRWPIPAAGRACDVVVVGGGPSGLVAAYRLRDRDIVLLEKESEVGGNARADYWDAMPYAAVSHAFYSVSPAAPLYSELGLQPVPLTFDPVTIVGDQVIRGDLFENGLGRFFTAAAERRLREARTELFALDVEGSKERLDQLSFSEVLRPYGSEVKEFFDDLLAWFAAGCDELSGYAGILLARGQMGAGFGPLYPEGSSKGGVFTFPGGLSHAALALKQKIEAAGSGRVITGVTVYHVQNEADGVLVAYLQHGQPTTIRAKTVIMAAPKFIARHIVSGLPRDQQQAMGSMRYAPYLGGAVCVDEIISGNLRTARILRGPIASLRDNSIQPGKQMFRIEIPLKASKRSQLLSDIFMKRLSADIVTYFDHLFPGSARKISEVRIWRRGHNWYIPVPRMITQFQATASRNAGRIFFACADSIGPISDFGWAMLAADRAVAEARRVIAKGA
ncbi:MAG: FAD-dependent oxidoreductase [Acidobacteria bacterium]|nr:FAD-dependent oxidoreductase [Acidobacteriota bacterium]